MLVQIKFPQSPVTENSLNNRPLLIFPIPKYVSILDFPIWSVFSQLEKWRGYHFLRDFALDLNSGLQTRTSLATGCPSLTKHEQHWTCPPSCTFPVVVGKWCHHLPPCSSQSYFHLFFHHLFTHIQSPPLLPNTFQIIFQDSTQSHPLQEFFTGHLPQASILV